MIPAKRRTIQPIMQRWIESIGGLCELARLAVRTRFQFRSPYWRWRYETAFGTKPEHIPSRRKQFRAILEYGRWMYRIRKKRW